MVLTQICPGINITNPGSGQFRSHSFEKGDTMASEDAIIAVSRLKNWIIQYGDTKSRAFIGDVTMVTMIAEEAITNEKPRQYVSEENWKSSVLKCAVGDHDCSVCRFVEHDERSPHVLMDVIRVLDAKLDDEERINRSLLSERLT